MPHFYPLKSPSFFSEISVTTLSVDKKQGCRPAEAERDASGLPACTMVKTLSFSVGAGVTV